jgi:hypothetical protein
MMSVDQYLEHSDFLLGLAEHSKPSEYKARDVAEAQVAAVQAVAAAVDRLAAAVENLQR